MVKVKVDFGWYINAVLVHENVVVGEVGEAQKLMYVKDFVA